MLYPPSEIRMLADGLLDHPECVAEGPDGFLYAGGEAGQVYRIAPGGKSVETIANTGGMSIGIALDPECNVYVCDSKLRAVVRATPQGRCEVFSEGAPEHKFVLPNYPVFDRQGNLYVSDSGGWKQGDGKILKLDPQGRAGIFSPGPFHFTNGLALDAGERFLYVVESNLDRVLRIAIEPDGTAGETSVFVENMYHVPDGLAFDAAGNLYVTTYANHSLYRVSPEGRAELLSRDMDSLALNQPTNCAFGGPAFDRLYVANLGGWHIAELDLGVKGQPLYSHRGKQAPL